MAAVYAQFLYANELPGVLDTSSSVQFLDSLVIRDPGSSLYKRAVAARSLIEAHTVALGESLQKHWEENMLSLDKYARDCVATVTPDAEREASTPLSSGLPLLDTLAGSRVVLITGLTGSGKSTRVPAELLTANPCGRIIVSEPRRVAAISLAEYQRKVLPADLASKVGYAVRFQAQFTKDTVLLYQTDGVTLQHFLNDPCLLDVSHLIIDEVHECSTDQLLILAIALRVLRYNANLRLLLMSATLDESALIKYVQRYTTCASLSLNMTQYTTSITHLPCREDYITQAVDEVVRLHTNNDNLDDGILVFFSGSDDIAVCLALLRDKLSQQPHCNMNARPCALIPFHSKLLVQQLRYPFAQFPGRRKIVLATNIAETSITIPGIRYVMDTGLQKRIVFLPKHSTNVLIVIPITAPTHMQRKGRVGRTSDGACICLYPRSTVEQEMLVDPHSAVQFETLDSIVLILLTFVQRFQRQFPAFPIVLEPSDLLIPVSTQRLNATCEILYYNHLLVINASPGAKFTWSSLSLLPIGFAAAQLPVSPRMTLFLLVAKFYDIAHEACLIAAGIEVGLTEWLGCRGGPEVVHGSDHLSILYALVSPVKGRYMYNYSRQQVIMAAKQLEDALSSIHAQQGDSITRFLQQHLKLDSSQRSLGTDDLIQLCLGMTHHMTVAQRCTGGFRTLFSNCIVSVARNSACTDTIGGFIVYDHSTVIGRRAIAVCCTELSADILKKNIRLSVGTPFELFAESSKSAPSSIRSRPGLHFQRAVKK